MRQYAAQGSAVSPASRFGTFAIVKWSDVILVDSSSHVSGTDIVACGVARVEYAATLVAPRILRK